MLDLTLQTIIDILSVGPRTFTEIAGEILNRCPNVCKRGETYEHLRKHLTYLIDRGVITSMIDGETGKVYSEKETINQQSNHMKTWSYTVGYLGYRYTVESHTEHEAKRHIALLHGDSSTYPVLGRWGSYR